MIDFKLSYSHLLLVDNLSVPAFSTLSTLSRDQHFLVIMVKIPRGSVNNVAFSRLVKDDLNEFSLS